MSTRAFLAAALLGLLAGCGSTEQHQVRVLAPADLVEDVTSFEADTGCRVDLRVYDEGEDLEAIARRRNVDVVAGPVPPGERPDDLVELVLVTREGGVEVTVPERLARALEGEVRGAGTRATAWTFRAEGDNRACARAWVAYATSR